MLKVPVTVDGIESVASVKEIVVWLPFRVLSVVRFCVACIACSKISPFIVSLSFADDNDDCEGDLVCKQRDPKEEFRGCSGGESDNSGKIVQRMMGIAFTLAVSFTDVSSLENYSN